MSTDALEGRCHCGAVTVRLSAGANFGVVACHCDDCQRMHGNFFALIATDQDQVAWTGEDDVEWYASSPSVRRGFCRGCGSRIAKRPVEGSKIMLSVGLFGGATGHRIRKHVWSESKPDWYALPEVGA